MAEGPAEGEWEVDAGGMFSAKSETSATLNQAPSNSSTDATEKQTGPKVLGVTLRKTYCLLTAYFSSDLSVEFQLCHLGKNWHQNWQKKKNILTHR